MESQLQHTHGRHYDDSDALTQDGDELDENHGEKKSVIKKVKEKAKKIKNTITKHGHGGPPHDDDLEEEEEEETLTDEDPEVHGAPMYDSARVAQGGLGLSLAQPSSVIAEDRYPEPVASTNLSGPSVLGHDRGNYGQEKWSSKIGESTGIMDEEPFTEKRKRLVPDHVNDGVGQKDVLWGVIGKEMGMVPDPHAPKHQPSLGSDPSNYETKVANPTHTTGKEAELSQLQHSFDKMTAINDSKHKTFDPNHPQTLPSGHSSSSCSTNNPADYAHKITGTLAPVYEKVVISQLQANVTGTGQQQQVCPGLETDKGVSVKEHLVNKTLRPGDEDKALSEAITHTLHLGKEEESEKKSQPMGVVTESEEVQRRLGSTDRREERQDSGDVIADRGVGVADRLIDAMGSWFGGKRDAPQGTCYVTDEGLSRGYRNRGK